MIAHLFSIPARMTTTLFARFAFGAALLTGLTLASPTWAAPPFTVNANGTVTDSGTGLVWDQCSYGQTGAACAGGAALNGTWISGMVASRSANVGVYKGYTDWRVPNKNELDSLAKIDSYTAGVPTIDTSAFPGTLLDYYWTSSTEVRSPFNAHIVGFHNGMTYVADKSSTALVRLVRGGQFTDLLGPAADMSITLVDAPDPVATGASLTYTVTVTNNGPDTATSVAWGDTLPAATSFVSLSAAAGWSCTTPAVGAGGTVSCSTASVAAAASGVFTLTLTVAPATAAGTVVSNTATVSSATADPTPGNNSSTATTTVAVPVDTIPDPFSFIAQTGAALNLVATSNTITVAGINSASTISIVGGTYSIGGGAYTAAAGTVNNGQAVTVRQTASASYSTLTTATLTTGGIAGAFNVTTLAAPVGAAAIGIPTLSEWGMIILSGLLALFGLAQVRRR